MNRAIGDSYYKTFTTNDSSGSECDADATPSVVAYQDGTLDATFTLAVNKIADTTGRYYVSGTVPSDYGTGDCIDVVVSATVSGITRATVIDSFVVRPVATANVTLGAVTAVNSPGNRTSSPVALEMFQGEEKTFTITCNDSSGEAVDLSAKTLRFLVEDSNSVAKFKVEDPSVSVTGDSSEIASVTVGATQSATASTEYHWRLWSVDDDEVMAHGSFKIKAAKKDVS